MYTWCVHVGTCHGTCAQVERQLYRVHSLLPPLYGFWGLNSCCQGCAASPSTHWAFFLALHLSFSEQVSHWSWSLWTQLVFWLMSSRICLSLHYTLPLNPITKIRDMHPGTWLLTWVLGVQTQVLMFMPLGELRILCLLALDAYMWQVCYWLRHNPRSLFSFLIHCQYFYHYPCVPEPVLFLKAQEPGDSYRCLQTLPKSIALISLL